MKLGIARAYNGEHKNYLQEARKLGLDAFLFNLDDANWLQKLKPADAYLWHADSKEENYRVIHDRIYFLETIIGKPTFPDLAMYFAYGDKIKENDIFKYFNIPTPKTYITYSKTKALQIIETISYPFILKDAHGYGGWHVYKVNTKAEAQKFLAQIFSSKGLKHYHATMHNYFLAQEMVSVGKDLRVIVIGSQVVCAYWREAGPGEWKHNINQGSQANFSHIPKKALDMCLEIQKKLNFHWMSYDLFVTRSGKVLMNEFSCNFGIKAPTQAGYNIRKQQVEYIKNYLIQRKKKKSV